MSNLEICKSLYGAPNGDYAILEAPVGIIGPARIDNDLMYIGIPEDIFTILNYHMRQSDIANLGNMNQQDVSRYILGKSSPRLDPVTWRSVIKTCYRVCLQQSEHKHDVALYMKSLNLKSRRGRGLITDKRIRKVSPHR